MVAGVAALIRSAMPSLSKTAVDSIIMATVDTIDHLNPSYALLLGTGRINAYKALSDLAIARFTSDATDGQVPLTVNFTDQSPNSPTTWAWTFGDGGSSTDQNPSHEYTVPGVYDVSLVVNDANGVGEEHLKRYVWAQADSIKIDSLEVDPGTVVDVPFYLTNTAQVKNITLSFSFPNSYNVKPAGLVTAGTRSEDFAAVTFTAFDNTNKRYTVALQSSPIGQSNYLPPGSGVLMVLQLNVPSSVPPQTLIKIDTASWTGNQSSIETILGDYLPADIQPGYIKIAGCCIGQTGNVNGDVDDIVDISDLTALVNHLFVTFAPLSCPEEANTNGDAGGVVDISDLTALVNNLFVTFNPLAACQ
jgi:PKD repeat protein